jgi:integrase
VSRTGSVKRTGSTWGFVVDVGRKDGRRQQVRKRGFRTRKEAQTALNEALAELQRGSFVRPRRITFGSYLADWLAGMAISGRRPSTIAGYGRLIRIHVEPELGDIPIQDVTAVDLDRLYAGLAAVGSPAGWGPLSNRSIRYVHTVIGKALHDAERKGLVARNVARLASPPSAVSARAPEMQVWTPEQLRAFLEFAASSHHAPMLRLAAMTGLRRAELCGLRWQDVELDKARLVVRQSITTVYHRPVLGDVKTARSRRVIDIDATTVTVLRVQRAHQLEERLRAGPEWSDSGLVFTMPDGRGWHPDVISRAFARLVERSGLTRIRLHDLRHTHATHLLAAGTNVRVTSERLGHASAAFTLDVYGHVLPGQQANAAAAVAALVDSSAIRATGLPS